MYTPPPWSPDWLFSKVVLSRSHITSCVDAAAIAPTDIIGNRRRTVQVHCTIELIPKPTAVVARAVVADRGVVENHAGKFARYMNPTAVAIFIRERNSGLVGLNI